MSTKSESGKTFGAVKAPTIVKAGGEGIGVADIGKALVKLAPLALAACSPQVSGVGVAPQAENTPAPVQSATNTLPEATAVKPAEATPIAQPTEAVKPADAVPTVVAPTATVEAPQPSPTPSFEQWVQSTQPDAALLKTVETSYAAATGVNVESIQTAVEMVTINGNTVAVVVDKANGTPLLITDTNTKGERVWSQFTFGELARLSGKRFGVEALDGSGSSKMPIITSEFNQMHITAMSWKRSQPSESQTVLEIPQSFMTKALAAGETPTFAALVYGNSSDIPDWLKNGNYSRDQLISIMQNHVKAVMESNRQLYDKLKAAGQVNGDVKLQYIVVNEAVNEPSYFWQQKIGPQYIELAFQTARQADPQAVLLYNDFQHELPNGRNAAGVFNVVKGLKDKGLIDGVGMQLHFIGRDHFDPNTPIATLEAGIKAQVDKYAAIGVPVYATEVDVDLSKLTGTPQEKLKKAADIYRMLGRLFGSNANFVEMSVYGLSSESSWVKDLGGEPALLFTDYKPQATYYAALSGFFEGVKQTQGK